MLNGERFMLNKLIAKIRYLLLRIALPKQQFYLQGEEFHSVFHPIMKPILSGLEMIDSDLEVMNGESSENNNRG